MEIREEGLLPAVQVATVTPAVTAKPSATVEIKPEAPAEIELTFDATPKVVEVYRGAERIGTSCDGPSSPGCGGAAIRRSR